MALPFSSKSGHDRGDRDRFPRTWCDRLRHCPRPRPGSEDPSNSLPIAKNKKPRPGTHRRGYIPWHLLMR